MDVLQVIKSDQQDLLNLLKKYAGVSVSEISKAIDSVSQSLVQHFYVEQNYLYPELDACLKRAEVYLDVWSANHRSIQRAAQRLATDLKKKQLDSVKLRQRWDKLMELLITHFNAQNEVALPALRKHIPTQEREELSAVFVDAKEEARAAKSTAKLPARRATGS